jgi:hypothetical protein
MQKGIQRSSWRGILNCLYGGRYAINKHLILATHDHKHQSLPLTLQKWLEGPPFASSFIIVIEFEYRSYQPMWYNFTSLLILSNLLFFVFLWVIPS